MVGVPNPNSNLEGKLAALLNGALWVPPKWSGVRKISVVDYDLTYLKGSYDAPTYGSSPWVEIKKLHVGWNLHLHPLKNLGWKFPN